MMMFAGGLGAGDAEWHLLRDGRHVATITRIRKAPGAHMQFLEPGHP